MTVHTKKRLFHDDEHGTQVSLTLLDHGYLEPLIELLQSDREIPRMVRAVLRDMLNADPSRDFHLVCKPNGKRPRGRPSRSLKERIRDSEIGVRVEHSIKNGKEYKIAIYEAATEFGVKEPTAAKAYTTFKALLEAAEISDKTADKT